MLRLLALALTIGLLSPAAAAQDSVIEGEDGQLFLRQEVILDTDIASAWALWTTTDGVRAWIAPVAEVDLKPGGSIRTHYDANASIGDPGTIETKIVNYVPERMLTLQADLAPVQADWLTDAIRAEAQNLYNVVEFEPVGANRTRIVSWGIGYRNDPEWQTMIDFFKAANRWTFGELEKAITARTSEDAADPPSIENDPLAAIRFLSAQCWRGEFAGGPAYDVMCAENMPGGHIKARHMVRGIDGEYRGETVYFYDAEQQRIRFHYYTSLGAFQQGVVTVDGDHFDLDPIRHIRADGTVLQLRATGERLADGYYRTTTHFWRDGAWGEPSVVVMQPIDCADWAAVEAGCR